MIEEVGKTYWNEGSAVAATSKVRRTLFPGLCVLIMTLRCGVDTSSGRRKEEISSGIDFRASLEPLYQDLMLLW